MARNRFVYFLLSLPGDKVDNMLKMFKDFLELSLPYEIVMAIGVIPMERTIPDISREDSVGIDEVLLKKLKVKRKNSINFYFLDKILRGGYNNL